MIYFQIFYSSGKVIEEAKQVQDEFVIGRRSKAGAKLSDLFLDDRNVSRRHARLFRDAASGAWMLEDLGSTNGTKLDGQPVTAPQRVVEGNSIHVGTCRITFSHSPKYPGQAGAGAAAVAAGEDEGTFMAGETIMMSPAMAEATFVAPAHARDADATVMAPAVRGDEGEGTFVQPETTFAQEGADEEGTLVAPTRREVPVAATATHTAVRGPARPVMGTTLETRMEAPGEATLMEGAPAAPAAEGPQLSSLARELVQNSLLDMNKAVEIEEKARKQGLTFFRALAQNRSVRFMDELITWVAKRFQFPVILDEEAFAAQVISSDWLDYNQAADQGLVLLKPETEDRVRFATIDPFDIMARDWVERCAGKPADQLLVHPEAFFGAMRNLRSRANEEIEEMGVAIDITTTQEHHIREQTGDVPIPLMVNYFLHKAHVDGASDIHIEPTEEKLMVRNRVDGILHEELTMPVEFHPEVVSRLKIMSGMDVAEKRRPQDGRFGVVIRNNPIDVRVSSYPTVFGEKFVLRLLDKNALQPSIENMGMMHRDLHLLKTKISAPYGLIMISGPTGSGKTTTLYSCLAGLDKTSKNVLTVEDPVEYRLKGVHQMQVNHKIGLTFASGLRTILRQDPDVIMVGEIRDQETASMAVQASLTGHIVFSTIHTNTAIGVITRLLDMGLAPFLVANSVSLAVAQRLVRTICPKCVVTVEGQTILDQLNRDGISDDRLAFLGVEIDPDMEYTQGSGCTHCRDTGYAGRRAVFELFDMTDEARSMIMSPNFNADDLKEYAARCGMTTLIEHGKKLVEEEVTTFSEIIRVLGEK